MTLIKLGCRANRHFLRPGNEQEIGAKMSNVSTIGHNSGEVRIRIEVRLFNSLTKYNDEDGVRRVLETAAGTTVGDLIRRFRLPLPEIYLVLKNGRDITPGLYQGGVVNEEVVVDDGDVIAFSGPVPYSPGFGAPVV